MKTLAQEAGYNRLARAQELAGPILVWAVWVTMTAATILFIRHYARNIPYMDDFKLVPIMTGHEPLSLHWLRSQHYEDRPLGFRLIAVSVCRFTANDFRSGLLATVPCDRRSDQHPVS